MRTANKRVAWEDQHDQYDQRNNSDRDFYQSRNENYGNDDYYQGSSRRDRGYGNPDYDERNYRFGQREEMEWGNGSQQYVPEMDYGPRRRNPRTQVTGYGNQNSRFMNEFEQWRNGSDNFRNDYFERDRNYNSRQDYNNGDYRSRQDAVNYEQSYYERGPHQRPHRSTRPEYNYYESYPSYGQGAPYSDHERGDIDNHQNRGRRGIDNEDDYSYSRRDDSGERRRFSSNEYDRRNRPMIRDKRY